MKLLFDQNLSSKLCGLLSDVFPDSAQVRMLGLDRASDRQIWDYAREHGYTIATQDVDFANMTAYLGGPPNVVWLRCGNRTTVEIALLLRAHAQVIQRLETEDDQSIAEVLWDGSGLSKEAE